MFNFDKLRSSLKHIQPDQASLLDLQLLAALHEHYLDKLNDSARLLDGELPSTSKALTWLLAGKAITGLEDEGDVGQVIAGQLSGLLGMQACFIFKWDQASNALSLWKMHPPQDWTANPAWEQPFRLGDYPVFNRVLSSKQIVELRLENRPSLGEENENLQQDLQQDLQQNEGGLLLMLPVAVQEAEIGLALLVADRSVQMPGEHELILGLLLANQAAQAILQIRRLNAARQRIAHLEAVSRASTGLAVSLNMQAVMDAILNGIFTLLPGTHYAHLFLNEAGDLKFGAAQWAGKNLSGAVTQLRPGELAVRTVQMRQAIVWNEKDRYPFRSSQFAGQGGALAGLPLEAGDQVVGVIIVSQPQPFSADSLGTLEIFLKPAALAIKNARLHTHISQQALTDSLTGLPNRRALDQRLEDEIRRSSRYQHPITLIMLDINGFKRINDRYGHPVGDGVLQQVAACLRKRLRDTDFLARYGGDEFAAILPETDLSFAKGMASRLAGAVSACPLELPGSVEEKRGIKVKISLGMAIFPAQAITAAGLLIAADQALYQAKTAPPPAER